MDSSEDISTVSEEGSRFDDVQKEKEQAEQKRLEALYFEEVHAHKAASSEEVEDRSAAGAPTLHCLVALLVVALPALGL